MILKTITNKLQILELLGYLSAYLSPEEVKSILYPFSEAGKLHPHKDKINNNPLVFFCGVFEMAGKFCQGFTRNYKRVYYLMTEDNSPDEKIYLRYCVRFAVEV